MRSWEDGNSCCPIPDIRVCSSFRLRFMIWLVGSFLLYLYYALGCVVPIEKDIL